jgi:hypothetical protein
MRWDRGLLNGSLNHGKIIEVFLGNFLHWRVRVEIQLATHHIFNSSVTEAVGCKQLLVTMIFRNTILVGCDFED